MIKNEEYEQYFLVLLVFALFAMIVMPLAQAVILGFLVALVVHPLYRWFLRFFGKREYLAALLTTFLFAIGVVIPLVLMGVTLAKESATLIKTISESTAQFDFSSSIAKLKSFDRFNRFIPFSEEDIRGRLQEFLGQAGSFVATALAGLATSLPALGLSIVIFLVSFYYALVDGQRLTNFLERCLPFGRTEVADLFSTTEKICRGVVVGSLVAGVAQGIVIAVAFLIFGIPGAFLFGSMTIVFSFVPILGCMPGGIGGVIYLLVQGRQGAAVGMFIAFCMASIADNVTKPMVLKGAVELHPLLGLVSALGGLAFFGFVGLFLGPLFAAIMVVILDMIASRNSHTA